MIRKILATLIVLTCFVATPAFTWQGDEYRPYLTLGGGVNLLADMDTGLEPGPVDVKVSADQGFNGFIAGGRAYDDGRVEFSFSYHAADLEEVEINSTGAITDLEGNLQVAAFLASIFWDFNTTGAISPYFGVGIGACQIRIDDTILGADNRDSALAYQFGLGMSFNMSENTKFDIGYKMLGVVEANLGPLDPDYLVMHNGNAALRFLF